MSRRRRDILRPAIGRAAGDDAWLAFHGAKYHFAQLLRAFEAGLETDRQHARLHWHLRAFFWELVSVRDALARDSSLDSATTALGRTAWFQEVDAYRNFAHHSFNVVRVLRPATGGKAIAFQLQRLGPGGRAGDARPILRHYIDEMGRFLAELLTPSDEGTARSSVAPRA